MNNKQPQHPIHYLAPGIGVLIAALANPLIDHLSAFTMDDLFDAPRNAINSMGTGSSQAQEPLSVPRTQPPIGNGAAIQPCAAPPPLPVAAVPNPEEMPPESRFSTANIPSKRPAPAASIKPYQPPQPVQTTQPIAPMDSGERVQYSQGGAVTQAKADRMSKLAKPQSRKAIISFLGGPKWVDKDSDVYQIEGTSDGITASRRLVIRYDLDPESKFAIAIATDWYQQ